MRIEYEGTTAVAQLVLFYFPAKEGLESSPIPNDELCDDPDNIPLTQREPGLLTLWQDLFLSGGYPVCRCPVCCCVLLCAVLLGAASFTVAAAACHNLLPTHSLPLTQLQVNTSVQMHQTGFRGCCALRIPRCHAAADTKWRASASLSSPACC